MIGAFGAAACTFAISDATGLTHQRSNSAGGKTPAHEFEDLHRFRAGGQLTHKIFGRGADDPLDQCGEQLRLPIGEKPRRRLIGRALPGHHIARDRPGSAAKADQRDVAREQSLQTVERLEHGRELRPIGRVAESRQAGRVTDRGEPRAFAALEGDVLSERVGNDENVGEKDRRVEAEAADRLESGFDRKSGRVTEIEESRGASADLAIFGKIAARLTHEPDRWPWLALTRECGEKGLFGGGHTDSLIRRFAPPAPVLREKGSRPLSRLPEKAGIRATCIKDA